jgi:outer membrane protein assembly factor BamA
MTQMLFSDIMGDHQIFFQGYFLDDLRNSSFLVQYNYLPELIDYGISLYHNSYLFRKDDAYIRFRNLGLSANGSLPFDLYRRFDFTLSFMNLTLENASNPQIPSFERLQLIPSVKYVFDNTLQGWYGPNKGLRYYISAETSPKLFSSSASFYNFETDIRFYQPIVENYITLALRGSAGASYGSQPQKFFLGGTENWFTQDYSNNFNALSDPLDYAFLNFKMPLRGWSLGQKAGSKFFLFNSELRFPLFTALVAGPVPVLLQGVQGALFFDLGGAFDQKFVPTEKDLRGIERQKDMLMSSGVGVRSYLLGMPFKLDIAWSNLIYTWSKPRYMFSLGYDF